MKKYVLFIGIDMSKKWFDASLTTDGDKKQMLHKQFNNTTSGFRQFINWIKKQARQSGIEGDWLFCLEHTGVYTLPLCVFLEQEAFDFVLESALRIKRSLGIRRGKNDKADSKDICAYAYFNVKRLKISKLAAKELMQLKNLLSHRARLVKQRAMFKGSFGEYDAFMPKEFSCSSIEEDNKELIAILSTKIRAIDQQIKQIIQQNEELNRLYQLARSVKGIGPVIAATLLVYTNAFKAFDNARKFACYIGIAPFEETSGTSVYIPAKVSRLAYLKIKALIGNGVNSAVRHDKELRAYYQRKIAEGKNKYKVLNALKNKLIARVFATVKRGTPYVELFNYA